MAAVPLVSAPGIFFGTRQNNPAEPRPERSFADLAAIVKVARQPAFCNRECLTQVRIGLLLVGARLTL